MARVVRSDFPGAVHHVYGRGNGRQDIFKDSADFRWFLKRLLDLKTELQFCIYAYCLMPNHYHLAIETGKTPLNRLMHRLLTSFARVFNDRWETVGHPFQGRYGARHCANDNELQRVIRYINLNPVEAGLCASAEDWPWSGQTGLMAGADDIVDCEFVVNLFGGLPSYQEFLRQKNVQAERASLGEIALGLGGESAVLLTAPLRTAKCVELRRIFVSAAIEAGYRVNEIAAFLGRTPGAVSHLLQRSNLACPSS